MANFELQKQDPQTVVQGTIQKKRTLMIGIGGSGKEVIMRFRRKLADIYDGLDQHPYIEYLWIDTDSRNKSIRNTEWDKTFTHAMLNKSQIIDASMTVGELQAFYDNFAQHESYHHWFNIDALKGMGAQVLMQGASAMRPFGKLAFWYHADNIYSAFSSAITRLQNANFKVQNLSSANDIDVYVIGSMAGGTGSGMLIDTAVMLQKVSSNISPTGIFFLSDVFAHDSENPVQGSQDERDANCFAALQELDFYMTPENAGVRDQNANLFDFNWKDQLRHTLNLPVYKKLNLVSNSYENSQVEPSLEEAFNIVAEYLIMGYNDTGFDSDVRSARTNVIRGYNNRFHYVNVIQTPKQNKKISTPYSTTYTGLGLGLIEFNKRRIKNWAKYSYLAEFCKHHINQREADKSLYTDQDGMTKCQLLNPDHLWLQLETGGQGVSPVDDMMKQLRSKRAKKVEELLNMPDIKSGNFNRIEAIKASLAAELDKFFVKMREDMTRETQNDANYKGKLFVQLDQYRKQVLQDIPNSLEVQYYKVLEAMGDKGVISAASFLEEVKKNHLTLLKQFLGRKTGDNHTYQAPDEFVLPDATSIQIEQGNAEEANQIPLMFIGYRRKAVSHYESRMSNAIERYKGQLKKAITEYASQHESELSKLLEFSCYRIVAKGYEDAVKAIEMEVDMLANSHHSTVKQALQNWGASFAEYAKAYEFKQSTSAMRKLVLDNYLKTEIESEKQVIVDGDKSSNYRDFTSLISRELNQQLETQLADKGLGQSPSMIFIYALANHPNILNEFKVSVQDVMEKCAEKHLSGFSQNRSVDTELYKLLQDNTLKQDLEAAIRKVHEQSCMRLKYLPNPAIQSHMAHETIPVNGISTSASSALTDELNRILGGGVGFNKSDLDENIVFYKEGSGFPLVALEHIDKFRPAFYKDIARDPARIYQRYTSKDFEFLRTLRCMTDDQFLKFSNSYRTAMKAVLLGVVTYEEIALSYGQKERRFRYKYREMGIDNRVDLLKQLETIADELLQPDKSAILERIKGESDLQELAAKDLIALLGAITLNLRALKSNNVAEGSTTMGTWAMEEIREMVQAQLRQKMAEEYSTPEEMEAYISSLYELDFNEADYKLLEYYTSEFKRGILVMK